MEIPPHLDIGIFYPIIIKLKIKEYHIYDYLTSLASSFAKAIQSSIEVVFETK